MSLETLPAEEKVCKHDNRIKNGSRYNKNGIKKQKFRCKDCGWMFIEGSENRFPGTFYDEKIVTTAVELSQTFSTRKIANRLKEDYGIVVTHVTVSKWIKKYSELISKDPYDICKRRGLDYYKVREFIYGLIVRKELSATEEDLPYLKFISDNFGELCKRMGVIGVPKSCELGHDYQREAYVLKIK